MAASGIQPDLIKIDVEGTELSVLEGFERTLREARPSLVIEIHDIANGSAVRAFLQEYDYHLSETDINKNVILAH